MAEVIFKTYNQDQLMLLPPALDELIPAAHLSRIVNQVIDSMSDGIFKESYVGGGTTSYHPKMLAKVIVYGYLIRVYSGRQMAKLLKENVVFMWLAGQNQPDFRTINRFRSQRFKDQVRAVFKEVLVLCEKLGLIQFENYFVDGTKLEANANRHKMVWKKQVKNNKQRLDGKINALLDEIDQVIEKEEAEADKFEKAEKERDEAFNSERTKAAIRELEERLKKLGNPKRHPVKKLQKQMNQMLSKRAEYEQKEKVLGERNSYSKTDTDAIGMRMKNSDEVRPGYNAMIGTENQIILNYDLHQKAGDSNCFIPHMSNFKELHGRWMKQIVGDAAFGGHENWEFIEKEKIGNYLKYNMFYKETRKRYSPDPVKVFPYNVEQDYYTCPAGETLRWGGQMGSEVTANGFLQRFKIYRTQACFSCKNKCTDTAHRTVRRNEELERLKAQAKNNLQSEQGVKLRSLRGVEVESAFGDIKQNMKFRRFNLRGLKKASVDFGIACIAHNIRKIALAAV
jgi:transposase